MKKFLLLLAISILTTSGHFAFAGEGMWIPSLLKQLNEKEMKAMGMKISADDIYSLNHSSMKDAIMLFGRGCTSELISGEGLLLTNHHCGFSSIQKHSSVEHDYLKDGFWAMNRGEELPNPGLTATLMIRMDKVTDQVLQGVNDQMSEKERKSAIEKNTEQLIKNFEKDSPYQATIKSFFKGNEYYMIVTETFKDVRLVGAPPSAIGKFGGDTDNWMWPRHTGDFSLFRIYVSPDGKPAAYSKDNVPYQPNYFFPISLKGVNEGDFTFVFGYPARTNEYLPSYAIEEITKLENPAKIKLRTQRLDIFKKYAETSPKIRIMYASKQAGVANGWKKMIGQDWGIKRTHAIEKKQQFEQDFQQWATANPHRTQQYGDLLNQFKQVYQQIRPYQQAADYVYEGALGVEAQRFALSFLRLAEISKEHPGDTAQLYQMVKSLQAREKTFYKDYYKPLDMEVMAQLLNTYDKNVPDAYKPAWFAVIHKKFNGDYKKFTEYTFKKSFLDDPEALNTFLKNYRANDYKKLEKDQFFQMAMEINRFAKQNIWPKLDQLSARTDSLMRIYMRAQMEMQSDKRFYPDANFTLRVTYGKAGGFSPADAVEYKTFTTMKGILEKENPDIYDYAVPEKLKTLYKDQDFGPYADKDGSMHVCFVAKNHTSGGNSGSPVLNAEGQLIGVNFDRDWEGTMSDLNYDPSVCRNISLDIRYFLFVVDKLSGAGYLLDEMKIVK
ncbi:MAG: S46 family peptidase [Bacteroidales bacterium]|nr:S46 family peptidase [Bacteroidales bacterium]